jgi:hypothetical protein
MDRGAAQRANGFAPQPRRHRRGAPQAHVRGDAIKSIHQIKYNESDLSPKRITAGKRGIGSKAGVDDFLIS